MTEFDWWRPLLELSDPALRPTRRALVELTYSQSQPEPIAVAVSRIAEVFKASTAILWEFSSEDGPKLAVIWPLNGRSERRTFGTRAKPTRELVRLIELCQSQQRPLWVEPENDQSHELQDLAESQETPSVRIFTTLTRPSSIPSVLQLEIPADSARVQTEDRDRYLHAIFLLSRQPMLASLAETSLPEEGRVNDLIAAFDESLSSSPLAGLEEIIDEHRVSLIRKLEAQLAPVEGTRFHSLSENQSFVTNLQRILESAGLRVLCSQCGEPAILRCLASRNANSGSFVFDHTKSGSRTFHGGRTHFPKLILVSRPSRKPRQARSTNDP